MRLNPVEVAQIDAKIAQRIQSGQLSGGGREYKTISSQLHKPRNKQIPQQSESSKEPKKQSRKKKSKMTDFVPKELLNVHAMALARLSADPTLRTGLVVDGEIVRKAAHEHWLQVEAFNWLFETWREYYDDFAAVPNGGSRTNATAQDLTDEGVKEGYPDVTGDIPKGKYHGVFIEFKWGRNRPSAAQVKMLRRKASRGYFVCVVYTLAEFTSVMTRYFNLKDGESMDWSLHSELWEY